MSEKRMAQLLREMDEKLLAAVPVALETLIRAAKSGDACAARYLVDKVMFSSECLECALDEAPSADESSLQSSNDVG